VRARWGSRRPVRRRVGAHQQPRARTVRLEARVTATWNACSLGVVGGPKGLKDRKRFTTRKPRSVSLFSGCSA
jgi:hypothetical protein